MSIATLDKRTRRIYRLIFASLLLLFNPNIHIIDFLPDFIAYFIIYSLLDKAADSAAYFAEARNAFLKLGYVTLSKIPVLFLVYSIRSGNTRDVDIFALVSLVYAVLELVFLIPAITNLFDALFHLGQRTEASALIKPFKINKRMTMSPESLKATSYAFAVCKSVLFVIPELFLLTTTSDIGNLVVKFARLYPYALICALIIGTFIGISWLLAARKYLKAVVNEGEFDNALELMQTEDGRERYQIRSKTRKIKTALTVLALSSFFTVELVFSDFEEINLLPHFIYGFALLFAMKMIYKHSKSSNAVYFSGGAYIALSAITYAVSFRFLNNFDYYDLLSSAEAMDAYQPLLFLSVIELISLLVFLFFTARSLKSFIAENTGLIAPNDNRYSAHKKEYHRSLMKKIYIMFSLSGVAGIAKCIHVFLNREVSVVLSSSNPILGQSYIASKLPWFNLVVFATGAIYIGYSLYFLSELKDEVSMKHDCEL